MSLLKELKQSLKGKRKHASARNISENVYPSDNIENNENISSEIENPFAILRREFYLRNRENKLLSNEVIFKDLYAKTSNKCFSHISNKYVDTVLEEESWRKILQIDFDRKVKHDPWFHRFVLHQDYNPRDESQSMEDLEFSSINKIEFKKKTFSDLLHVCHQPFLVSWNQYETSAWSLWGIERDIFQKWISYLQETGYLNEEEYEKIRLIALKMASRKNDKNEYINNKFISEYSNSNKSTNKKINLNIKENNPFEKSVFRSDLQQWMFEEINQYQDFWFADRNRYNQQDLMECYVLHIVNHILKSKRYQWYNDEKKRFISKGGTHCEYIVKDTTLSPGRVLILVPFKHTCYQIVSLLTYFMPKILSIKKEEAFEKHFGPDSIKSAFTSGEYQNRFPGNLDDNFVFGIILNHGQLSYFSPPETSDIIIATPLGLSTNFSKDKLSSLLSSIEVCIADRVDTIQMQNWELFMNVFDQMNIPQDSIPDSFDISRLKSYNLHETSRYFRQTILISEHITLDIKTLFEGPLLQNISGKIYAYQYQEGCISTESVPITFEKVKCSNFEKIDDYRLKYFINEIMPKFANDENAFILIIVSSSFDMIRLKKYMTDNNEKCVFISDEVGSAERIIEKAKKDLITFVFISERQWYFHETKSQYFPMNRFVFYSIPEYPQLFKKFIQRADSVYKKDPECEVICLFHKIDVYNLEKAIGEVQAKKLVTSKENIFEL